MAFACTVVTPEKQAFEGQISQAIVPAHDGLIGILTNRAPLLVKLGVGPLQIDLPDHTKLLFLVDGGVAEMKDNALTILTTEAVPADEIDFEAARADFAAAAANPGNLDEKAYERHQHRMARARALQHLAGRK